MISEPSEWEDWSRPLHADLRDRVAMLQRIQQVVEMIRKLIEDTKKGSVDDLSDYRLGMILQVPPGIVRSARERMGLPPYRLPF